MKALTTVKNKATHFAQKWSAVSLAPTERQAQVMLFVLGVTLLTTGLISDGQAQLELEYNDDRLAEAINGILTYVEGTFGAMVMVAAGIGAIMSSAFGQYRAALGLLVVAVGAFVLRSFVGTFFNDENIQD